MQWSVIQSNINQANLLLSPPCPGRNFIFNLPPIPLGRKVIKIFAFAPDQHAK